MNISDLLTSLAGIRDLAGALINERDRQKAATIQIDLSEKLIQAQTQLFEVNSAIIEQQGRIAVLEQRIRDLEAEKAEQLRYRLTKVGTRGHFVAYQLDSAAEAGQSAGQVSHFFCQPCFDAGKKVVLTGNGEGYWRCPVCKHGASTEQDECAYVVRGRGRLDFDGY